MIFAYQPLYLSRDKSFNLPGDLLENILDPFLKYDPLSELAGQLFSEHIDSKLPHVSAISLPVESYMDIFFELGFSAPDLGNHFAEDC